MKKFTNTHSHSISLSDSESYKAKSISSDFGVEGTVDIGLLPLSKNSGEILGVLATLAESLRLDDVSVSSYLTAISRLCDEELELQISLSRLRFTENELAIHLAESKRELSLIKNWSGTIHSELGRENATSFNGQKVVLLKKAKEYKKVLDTLMSQMPDEHPITITDIAEQKDRIKLKEKIIKSKSAKIKAFQGLSPNLDLARHELIQAQNEQMRLVQLRERLLGKMADSVI